MKKILTLLSSLTLVAATTATVVACGTLNNANTVVRQNILGNNHELRAKVKETISESLVSTKASKSILSVDDLLTDINSAIQSYVASESEIDEYIDESTIEAELFWNYKDDDLTFSQNRGQKIETITSDFINYNFAVGLKYIEVELDDNERELEYDAISMIYSEVDLATLPTLRKDLYVEWENEWDETIADFKSEIVEEYFDSIKYEKDFWATNDNKMGVPTEFLYDDEDQKELYSDVKVQILDKAGNEIIDKNDIIYDEVYEVRLLGNEKSKTYTGEQNLSVYVQYDD
ncbi:lipoprotein [Spiroplasma endosymbiont of Anurida maritima]|uniref:lipoprotein n=1 Tax=Spiroplasma endosymbiont of Anurida maritima TaxID=2967972 RepID=UPI0036D23B10